MVISVPVINHITLLAQLLEGELESLRQEMSNGPLPENGVLPSEAAEKQASVSLEVHQEVLKGKEEALTQVQQAKDELSEQVKILEQKLTDVKAKNNVREMFLL